MAPGAERIAVSIPAFARGKGGAERTAATVAALLRAQGHAVALVCNEGTRGRPSYPVPEGVELIACNYFSRVPSKRAEATARVATFAPTMAILFYADASICKQLRFFEQFRSLTILAQECTNPVRAVRNIQRTYPARIDLRQAFWVRQAALSRLHAVRFTIPAYASSLVPDLRDRAVGFLNAFEFEELDQPPHGERTRIVCIGGLKDHNKNGFAVIRAFATIAARHPFWTLDFLGANGFVEEFTGLVRDLGLKDRVRDLGPVHSATELYRGAGVNVVASFEEGNPNVVNEAMAYGVPTLGFSDCSGVRHLIEHDQTGWLVDRRNEVAGLAAGMDRLLSSPELRERLTEAARPVVLKRCDRDRYARNWADTIALARRVHARGSWNERLAMLDELYDRALDAFLRPQDRLFGASPGRGPAPQRARWPRVRGLRLSRPSLGSVVRSLPTPRAILRRANLHGEWRSLAVLYRWSTAFASLGRGFGAYDRVILHDIMGALAALWLAGGRRSRIVLDVCETPRLRHRTTDLYRLSALPWHRFYEGCARWLARGAGVLLVQSPDLNELVARVTGRRGKVWVHIRSPDELAPIDVQRPPRPTRGTRLRVAWPSDLSMATGEATLRALLDDHADALRIVFIGARVSAHKASDLRRRYGDAIVLHERSAEPEYLHFLSECDVTLIAFDTRVENAALCVPNRLLDAMQIGVPVVSTPHRSVARLLDVYPGSGIVTRERSANALFTALAEAARLDPEPLGRAEIAFALDALPHVELVARLTNAGRARRIAVVSQRYVTDRPRFRQLVRAATSTGAAVTAFSRSGGRWVRERHGEGAEPTEPSILPTERKTHDELLDQGDRSPDRRPASDAVLCG